MRKYHFIILFIVFLLMFSNGMYGSPARENKEDESAGENSYIVEDALGRKVEFNKIPERIVLAGKSVFMVADAYYFFPEESGRLAAVGEITQGKGNFLNALDPKYGEIAVLDGGAGPEQIAAVNPDVVILKSFLKGSLGDTIEQLGIPVVYVSFELPEEYQRDIRVYGQLLQQMDRAEEIADYFQSESRAIEEKIASVPGADSPSALLLYYSSKGGDFSFNVPPAQWMQTILIEMAGGKAVWKDEIQGKGWNRVGFEQIAAWDPEYVIIVSYHNDIDQVMEDLKKNESWQRLKAYKNERLLAVPVDYYTYDQPDARWILGLKWMAKVLHGDIFSSMNLKDEIREFYSFVYKMDDESIENSIITILQGDI